MIFNFYFTDLYYVFIRKTQLFHSIQIGFSTRPFINTLQNVFYNFYQVGTYPMPEISAELSRGYPTSFLKLDPSSLMSGAKLSPSDVDAIAAAVEAETNQYSTRASGCGACPSGVNYGSCPAGYTESRAGECTPSPSYKGLCSKPVDISEFSEVEKDMMELTCDTCFKCA